MTEEESIARLLSHQLVTELMNPPLHGYFVCDQVKRPMSILGKPQFPCVITRVWQEGYEWVWEFHMVVPGPGPKRRYPSVEALVDDIIREIQICRGGCDGSTQS
jgi:hypothetical protein